MESSFSKIDHYLISIFQEKARNNNNGLIKITDLVNCLFLSSLIKDARPGSFGPHETK